MRVYCVRVYDRILSAEELAGHYAVDAERFISADMIDLDNPGKAVVTTTRLGSVGAPTAMGHYETDGLIAMWDGEDNMGTGAHVPGVQTWRDLVGCHADMTFTASPTIGANYYDLSAGGCGVPASDIAKALNDGQVTVEGEDGVVFHVGDTDFARAHGLSSAALKDEEWVVRSFGRDVVPIQTESPSFAKPVCPPTDFSSPSVSNVRASSRMTGQP